MIRNVHFIGTDLQVDSASPDNEKCYYSNSTCCSLDDLDIIVSKKPNCTYVYKNTITRTTPLLLFPYGFFDFMRVALPLNFTNKREKRLNLTRCIFEGVYSQEKAKYHWTFMIGKAKKVLILIEIFKI